MLTKLLHKAFLQSAEAGVGNALFGLGEHLHSVHIQVLPECQAQNIQVLTSITKCTCKLHIHCQRDEGKAVSSQFNFK